MFTTKPITPTTSTSFGLCSDSGSTKRLSASTKIEKHRARRKTALMRAPSTSARAQPKVFFDHFFGDICVCKQRE